MKRKKIALLLACFATILMMNSCSEENENSNTETENTELTPNDQNLGTTSDLDSYFPLTIGNTWIYKTYDGSAVSCIDTITIESITKNGDTLYYNSSSKINLGATMNLVAVLQYAKFHKDASGNVFIRQSFYNMSQHSFYYGTAYTFAPKIPVLNTSWTGNSGADRKDLKITGINVGVERYATFNGFMNNTMTPATDLSTGLLEITQTINSTQRIYYYFKKGVGLVCVEFANIINAVPLPTSMAIVSKYSVK